MEVGDAQGDAGVNYGIAPAGRLSEYSAIFGRSSSTVSARWVRRMDRARSRRHGSWSERDHVGFTLRKSSRRRKALRDFDLIRDFAHLAPAFQPSASKRRPIQSYKISYS
jgi:hypothetical protein